MCGVATRNDYCEDCAPEFNRKQDRGRTYTRRSTAAYQRWRRRILASDPVCLWPGEGGRRCLEPATVADHIIPISEAPERIFDLANGQGLCASHHSVKTAEESRGIFRDTRAD